MGTFFMFGRYSQESIKNISAKRTDETRSLIEKHGGQSGDVYPFPFTFSVTAKSDQKTELVGEFEHGSQDLLRSGVYCSA